MGSDPYVYEGSLSLINRLGIRDAAKLEAFERDLSLQRMSEGLPSVTLSPDGYRKIHHHLFQDVYDWAGKDRTVNIAKPGAPFCPARSVGSELDKLFRGIHAQDGLKNSSPSEFVHHAGVYLGELNVIHPFREGNGRTQRSFLQDFARKAGHDIDLTLIRPDEWHTASVKSFVEMDYDPMRQVIAASILPGMPLPSPALAGTAAKAKHPRPKRG